MYCIIYVSGYMAANFSEAEMQTLWDEQSMKNEKYRNTGVCVYMYVYIYTYIYIMLLFTYIRTQKKDAVYQVVFAKLVTHIYLYIYYIYAVFVLFY